MKIHEYQSKEILRDAGIEVPRGFIACSPDKAAAAFRQLERPVAVIKAQIHAGGRGKGTVKNNSRQHGVQLVSSAEEAERAARNLLGSILVTLQTGPDGRKVNQVLVEESCDIAQEFYVGFLIDRAVPGPVLIASSAGGGDIEQIAADTPELIYREPFATLSGLRPFQMRKIAAALGMKGDTIRAADRFLRILCTVFVKMDCSLLEINPLVLTKSGKLVALDAKLIFDDNAAFRHPELADFRDLAEEEPTEIRAAAVGLSYVKLQGNIGCLVNGAGLAMSTMDMIKLHGGEPANFLDVGGGADVERVTEAFRILFSDPRVEAVLVNIFGGITLCSTIAKALVQACKSIDIKVPLVVRLEGTEADEGREILARSGANIITANGLTEAAKKVVAAAAATPPKSDYAGSPSANIYTRSNFRPTIGT
jgi:succinyl-CoA synthetase beta subunit